ncbi:MAG: hypothetical protein IT559_04255 [Alphaproteobacteria bacterium]|nr:hypothetical protein [Alphaproteobacteria bacterium]
MKKYLQIFGLSCILALGSVFPASAEVFYWQDPGSKMSLSFPDRWAQVSNQYPGDVITIAAPGRNEFAGCHVNVQDDRRFAIYPAGYDAHIQRRDFSMPYWESYYGIHNNVVFRDVYDNAGLGRGFASMAAASYETASGPKMMKRSIAFASYYNNRVYTVECSAEDSVYPKWHNAFQSIIKSIDFHDPTNARSSTGYYRDFLRDRTLKVRGQNVFEDSYH